MWWFKCYENLRHVLFNGPHGHGSKCSTAKCAFQALEGLDVDIEARSFFAIREYIFKRHSNRIAARESLGFEESRLSVQMYSILLLRILIRAPTEQNPHGYESSKS